MQLSCLQLKPDHGFQHKQHIIHSIVYLWMCILYYPWVNPLLFSQQFNPLVCNCHMHPIVKTNTSIPTGRLKVGIQLAYSLTLMAFGYKAWIISFANMRLFIASTHCNSQQRKPISHDECTSLMLHHHNRNHQIFSINKSLESHIQWLILRISM